MERKVLHYLISFMLTCTLVTSAIGTVELAQRIGVNVVAERRLMTEFSLFLVYSTIVLIIVYSLNDRDTWNSDE